MIAENDNIVNSSGVHYALTKFALVTACYQGSVRAAEHD
jgi:hypothetical protein